MISRHLTRKLGVVLLVAAMLVATMATAAAASDHKAGVFGTVITAADADGTLEIRSKRGVVQVRITSDTQYRKRDESDVDAQSIKVGDEIGASGFFEGDVFVADIIMVIRKKAITVHTTGVITQADDGTLAIVTEDGSSVTIEFGLNGDVPAPGTVVTVVGRFVVGSGTLRAQGLQRLDQTLDRLANHLDKLGDVVRDPRQRVHHIARIQRMLEKASSRHIQILERVTRHLPEEARPAMEKALRNLDEANKAVLRAFNQALEIAEDTEQEHPRRGGRPDVRVPDGVEPSLNDIAEILGLSEDELVERMGRGLALAAIANERGFSEDDFKERVLALVRERVDGLIADGDLNGDDAAAIVDKVRDEAERHLVRVISDEESRSEGIPFSTEDLALILKIEASELVARLHNDESLLQIAEELGLTRERLLDEMISLARTRADALIERGAMRREDVTRFLRAFRGEIEERIQDRPRRDRGEDQERPITPQAVARLLGITEHEYFKHFENGGTLAELAELRGLSVDDLVEKIGREAHRRLERLVRLGEISADDARRGADEVREQVARELDGQTTRPIGRPDDATLQLREVPFDLERAAEALGLSVEELRALLSQGITVLRLADERGIPIEKIVARVTAAMAEKIGDLVDSGLIDAGRGRQMLANVREGVRNALREFRVVRVDNSGRGSERDRLAASFRPFPDVPLTIGDMAEVLGVSPEKLIERIKTGADFREFLVDHDYAVDEYVAAVVRLVEERLQAAAARRQIAAGEIGEMVLRLKRRLLDELSGEDRAHRPVTVRADEAEGRDTITVRAFPFNLGHIADILNLSVRDVSELLSQGHTMAEIAEKAGISLEEVATALVRPLEEKLARLADAEDITPEEAHEALNQARLESIRHLEAFRVSPAERVELSEDGSKLVISDRPVRIHTDVDEPDGVRLTDADPSDLTAELRAFLPRFDSEEDVYRFLGVSERARELRGRDLSWNQVARELGFGPDLMLRRLLQTAEEKITTVFSSRTGLSDEAKQLLVHFERLAGEWVAVIFPGRIGDPSHDDDSVTRNEPAADTDETVTRDEPAASTGETGEVSILDGDFTPQLVDSVEDVWRMLGVFEKAAELRGLDLTQAQVARELGLTDGSMMDRLFDRFEETISKAIRSGTLTSARAMELLTHFGKVAQEWVAVIFSDVPEEPEVVRVDSDRT